MKPAAVSFAETEHLYQIADRLHGVQIDTMDGLDFIRAYDHPRNFFMVDPPYLGQTRKRSKLATYEHEMMTPESHMELADVLHGIEGMCLICGYQSDLYRELYEDAGWLRVDTVSRVNSDGSTVESICISPRTLAQLQAEQKEREERERQEEIERFPLLAALEKGV